MKIVSIREFTEYKEIATKYIHSKWGNDNNYQVYEDSILDCVINKGSTPYWYLLEENNKIIGCAGLIDHYFISRTDLSPWLCSLYIESDYRGKALGSILIEKIKEDSKKERFKSVYLCTQLDGYYEKYGFHYFGEGFFDNVEPARIYEVDLIR
jgi:predicted GNAT family N-acyltransferase